VASRHCNGSGEGSCLSRLTAYFYFSRYEANNHERHKFCIMQVAASAALAMETNRYAGPSRDDDRVAMDILTTQGALCAEGCNVGSMARSSSIGRIKTKGFFNLMFLPTELRMKVGSYSFNVAASRNEYIFQRRS
jgi:hypothetical protein